MADRVRCWLVERRLDDGRVLTVTYATPDGTDAVTRQRAATAADVPASIEVDPERVDGVDDGATRERYRAEARRMAARHDPDDRL